MFRRVAIAIVIGGALVGCSLVVSLDGLNDNGGSSDASARDATPIDAAKDAAEATDASFDADVDAGPYFVVDDCVTDPDDVVDLTTAGTVDWVHWGNDADMKNVATHSIGPLVQSVNGDNPYENDSRMFSWTDGTNVSTVTNSTDGIYDDTGPMTLTILASPTRSVITLYIDAFSANATWMVALSPGPTAVTQSVSGVAGDATRYRCAIHVSSATAAMVTTTFSIAEQFDGGGGNIAMIAGTVSPE
jgi:hypothetical protein